MLWLETATRCLLKVLGLDSWDGLTGGLAGQVGAECSRLGSRGPRPCRSPGGPGGASGPGCHSDTSPPAIAHLSGTQQGARGLLRHPCPSPLPGALDVYSPGLVVGRCFKPQLLWRITQKNVSGTFRRNLGLQTAGELRGLALRAGAGRGPGASTARTSC